MEDLASDSSEEARRGRSCGEGRESLSLHQTSNQLNDTGSETHCPGQITPNACCGEVEPLPGLCIVFFSTLDIVYLPEIGLCFCHWAGRLRVGHSSVSGAQLKVRQGQRAWPDLLSASAFP